MKLFKKLAAAALAAVLALSMVGCGNANSVNSTKQLVLDLMADYAALDESELSNTAEMDGIAQKLLNKAAELYGTEQHAGELPARKTMWALTQPKPIWSPTQRIISTRAA